MFRMPLLHKLMLHKLATLAGTLMILLGLGLAGWALANLPNTGSVRLQFDVALGQNSPMGLPRLVFNGSPLPTPDSRETLARGDTGNSAAETGSDADGRDADGAGADSGEVAPASPDVVHITSPDETDGEPGNEPDGGLEATGANGDEPAPNAERLPAAVRHASVTITLDNALPSPLVQAVNNLAVADAHYFTQTVDAAAASQTGREPDPAQTVYLTWQDGEGSEGNLGSAPAPFTELPAGNPDREVLYEQYFAAATRLDTIDLNLRMLQIRRAWQGDDQRFQTVAVLQESLPALTQILGEPGDAVEAYTAMEDVVEAAWRTRDVLTLVPFHELTPELAVFTVDGQTPVENAIKFSSTAYPLIARLYAVPGGNVSGPALTRLAAQLPAANRESSRLTVVAITGVTAMVRFTAEQMDERGPGWPAEIVGPELATADITTISNEVPFVPDCETNTDPENLVFCSKPEYMETLERSGADIVGLTGNHLNDYGLEDALTSLEIYEEAELPVYGGGATQADALRPLIVEHHGNRLAFLGANSYGPPSAWAGEFSPGSAPFDLSMMSASIRNLKASEEVDLVLAELQYQESYGVEPLLDQRLDFSALARAGADVVTGVQSHVPQSLEFVEGSMVLYGLGNLYFDQMWNEDAREGLIMKHTIYEGRHISTQILPTLLYDSGQPRWPDAERRAAILAKVFAASYWE